MPPIVDMIKNIGTNAAKEMLVEENITLSPSQEEDLEKTVTGLKKSQLFVAEFPRRESKVLYSLRYGFQEAFFFILKLCAALSTLVLIVFAIAHVARLKNSPKK